MTTYVVPQGKRAVGFLQKIKKRLMVYCDDLYSNLKYR